MSSLKILEMYENSSQDQRSRSNVTKIQILLRLTITYTCSTIHQFRISSFSVFVQTDASTANNTCFINLADTQTVCEPGWWSRYCFSSASIHLCLCLSAQKLKKQQTTNNSNPLTEQHHSVSFPNIKNLKYTSCRQFNSEYQLWVLLRWRHCDVVHKH